MRETLAILVGPPIRTRPFGPTHDFGEEDATDVSKVIMSGQIGHVAGRLRLRQLNIRSLA